MADAGGLYLLVMPNSARYWRVKCRIAGKEKTLALGVYLTRMSTLHTPIMKDTAEVLLLKG